MRRTTIQHAVMLCMILMSMSDHLQAQARIGFTPPEIREEYKDKKITYGKTDDGTRYMVIEHEYFNVGHFFDKDNECFMSTVIPDNQKALNMIADAYSKEYVTINPKEWRAYTKDGVFKCTLVYDGDLHFFLWVMID
jgi:hypothetical protein